MRKIVIGVMGPNVPTERDASNARELGRMIAQHGWVLLSGGRKAGVMDIASEAARKAGGTVVGVLPGSDTDDASEFVDIVIVTDMGSARNNINVLSSDVVIACGMGAGTASELALAIKANKDVILLSDHEESKTFFKTLKPARVFEAGSAQEAIKHTQHLLEQRMTKKQVQ